MTEKHQSTYGEVQAELEYLHTMMGNVPAMFFQFKIDASGNVSFPFVSPGARDLYRLEPETIMADATSVIAIVHPEDAARFQQSVAESQATLQDWRWEGRFIRNDDSVVWIWGVSRPHRLDDGATVWTGVVMDVTQSKRAQEAEQQTKAQEATIQRQAELLAELSTPLIPLAAGVLVMPLIGTVDSTRAQQVLEALLEGVAANQADVVILDITGVRNVDEQIANTLIHAAQAVKLLGAKIVLTGIQARMAQTLVHLGVDLGGLATRSTLQDGIALALHQRSR